MKTNFAVTLQVKHDMSRLGAMTKLAAILQHGTIRDALSDAGLDLQVATVGGVVIDEDPHTEDDSLKWLLVKAIGDADPDGLIPYGDKDDSVEGGLTGKYEPLDCLE